MASAVAVGLAAALPWNVAGQPDAFEAVARSVGRPAGELADVYADLLAAAHFPAVVQRVGHLQVTAEELAETMVAEENLPMYRNNCRLADDDERLGLAKLDPAAVGAAARPGMRVITRIEISHHRLPLDPPFPASWDPQPRALFPATIVRVHDDAGHVGVGSGDAMYGFADYESYFLGEDPLDLERHAAVLSNIDFHAGRPWPLDVALWDLAGQIEDRPIWSLVGGSSNRFPPTRRRVSTVRRRTWSRTAAGVPPSSGSPRQGALRAGLAGRRPRRRPGDP